MEAAIVIKGAQERRGISTAELARRTDIEYEALRTAINGNRNITAEEFVRLCIELELDIDDFKEGD